MKINCPKCHKETEFFTNTAIDEIGEVFRCQHCGWPFRFVFDHIKKSYNKIKNNGLSESI